MRVLRLRTTIVCTKHASVPEIHKNKETVLNLRRQLSLSPATGPGRKARQWNSSVKDFSREFHHFAGIDNFEEYWEGFDLNIAVIFHTGSFYIVGMQMQYIFLWQWNSLGLVCVLWFCCIFGCKHLSNRKNSRHDISLCKSKKFNMHVAAVGDGTSLMIPLGWIFFCKK